MPAFDPYETLGVDRSATPDQIKGAFRKLAMQWHPDKNPGDPSAQDKFKKVNAAYQILNDPDKRAQFDRFGPEGPPMASGFQWSNVSVDGASIEDLFSALFGFGRAPAPSGDLQQKVVLTFEQAAFGCEKRVRYPHVITCEACEGSGAKPGASRDRCGACGGQGRQRFSTGLVGMITERTCSHCGGRGYTVSAPCRTCDGAGVALEQNELEITVPPGIENGATTLVRNVGSVTAPHGRAGDVELVFSVQPHPIFKREGNDLLCEVSISFPLAVLGGELDVPTLEGKATVKIPAGTQPGALLRLRGKGLRGRGGLGDQLLSVSIEVPTEVTARQRELLRELASEMGEPAASKDKGVFARLAGWFSGP
jgi:molecular chaperone DnaJ